MSESILRFKIWVGVKIRNEVRLEWCQDEDQTQICDD